MAKMADMMSIGSLSKKTGVSIETIRYYEQIGILAPTGRTGTGYRRYTEDSIQILNFVKQAKKLGFALSQVKELLSLNSNKNSKCTDVRDEAVKHLIDIEEKLKRLENIRNLLSELVEQCRPNEPVSSCPILACLKSDK